MKFEKRRRIGRATQWETVPESYVRKVFKCNFVDVDVCFRSMVEGLSVFTPFCEYRIKKETEKQDVTAPAIVKLPGV